VFAEEECEEPVDGLRGAQLRRLTWRDRPQRVSRPLAPWHALSYPLVMYSELGFSSCFSAAYGKKRRRPEHRAPAHPEDRKAIRCTRMCGCRPSPFCRRALLLPAVSSYTGMQVRRVLHLVDNGTASLAVLWCPSNPDANTRICTLLHGVLCGWWSVAPSCPRCFYASCMIDYLFPFLF